MGALPDKDDAGRTDPRVDRTRIAVLAAARAVLVGDGWDAVTHQRVAQESGISRATLYRHWPERSALLYEVLAAEEVTLHIVPTGDLRQDLVAHLEMFRTVLADEVLGRVVTALVDRAEWEPAVMQIKVAVAQHTLSYLRGLLECGIRSGELAPDLDVELATSQLLGPVAFRRLVSAERMHADFTRAVVDDFLTLHRV